MLKLSLVLAIATTITSCSSDPDLGSLQTGTDAAQEAEGVYTEVLFGGTCSDEEYDCDWWKVPGTKAPTNKCERYPCGECPNICVVLGIDKIYFYDAMPSCGKGWSYCEPKFEDIDWCRKDPDSSNCRNDQGPPAYLVTPDGTKHKTWVARWFWQDHNMTEKECFARAQAAIAQECDDAE